MSLPRGAGPASAAAVGLLLLVLAACGADEARGPAHPPARGPEGEAGPASIGAEACRGCHPQEFAAWQASPHGRHAVRRAEPPGAADHAVGSSWMQAYLKEDAHGALRILPICRDLREDAWRPVEHVLQAIRGDPGVGPPAPTPALAERRFELDCAGCHASEARVRIEPVLGRFDTRWRSLAIDCESCHGPARAHVEAWQALGDGAPLARLERLPARARTAVCARCHGGPPAGPDFAPEDAIAHVGAHHDLRSLFSHGAAAGQTYQAEAFGRSPCHLEGGLACMDCHDAHATGPTTAASADARCVRCHEGFAQRAHTHHDARGEGARCVNCHMPRLVVGLLAHQRDHRIGVPRPGPDAPDACSRCHEETSSWAAGWVERWWGSGDEATREAIHAVHEARAGRGATVTAALEAARTHEDAFFRVAALRLLGPSRALLEDREPSVRLEVLQVAAASANGTPFLEGALDDPEPLLRAYAWLALFDRGAATPPVPVEDLRTFVRVRRLPLAAWLALGLVELGAGRYAEARALLEHGVALTPSSTEAWPLWAAALDRDGRPRDGAAVLQRFEGAAGSRERWEALRVAAERAGLAAGFAEGEAARRRLLPGVPPGDGR